MLLRNTNDTALLAAWRAGNADAGAQLFRRHYSSIARFFNTKIGHDSEDLIQATFLACVEGVDGFRAEVSFRNYLFGIARKKLLRHLRTRVRDRKYFDPRTASVAQTVHSATELIAGRRQRERLLIALRQLPVDTQLMLELHYWEDMRIKDIAEIVQLPVNTVKCHMRRGRIQLARELALATETRPARSA